MRQCDECNKKQCRCAKNEEKADQMREMMHIDIEMHQLFAGF